MKNYPTQTVHKNWLYVTAFAIWSFGPVFFLGSTLEFSDPARLTLNLLGWNWDPGTSFTAPETRFLSALTGGFLMGWGLTVLALRNLVFDLAPEGVRKTVLIGLMAWFVTDSTGSVLSGNPVNVVFNVLVLAIGVGPLAWKAR